MARSIMGFFYNNIEEIVTKRIATYIKVLNRVSVIGA